MSGDIEESSDPRASSPQSIWQGPSPTRAHNLHSYLLYDMSLDVNETNKEQTQNEVCHHKDLTGVIIIPWVGANEGGEDDDNDDDDNEPAIGTYKNVIKIFKQSMRFQ